LPSPLLTLGEDIDSRSALVASCDAQCAEARHDRKHGVLPRCLFLKAGRVVPSETQEDELSGGTVVVGLNPGKMKEPERRKINELLDAIGKDRTRFSAENWQAFARAHYQRLKETVAGSVPYYTIVRALLRSSGRMGPILWTEILKCETRTRERRACGEKRAKGSRPLECDNSR
jgi:hypothetical protein